VAPGKKESPTVFDTYSSFPGFQFFSGGMQVVQLPVQLTILEVSRRTRFVVGSMFGDLFQ
jgi:hypothetical protein